MVQKSLILLIVALAVMVFPPESNAAEDVPHAFMTDVYQCSKCHEKVPLPGQDDFTSIVLKKDIVTLCEECHQAMINDDKHPVDIRPDRKVPEQLHLDNYFSVTCVTCHDPHSVPFADFPYIPYTWMDRIRRFIKRERRHRTYFLRKNNVDGALCLSCHSWQSLDTDRDYYVPPKEELYAGSHECRECHDEIYSEWESSVHARFVGKAKENPGVIKGNFTDGKPFTKEEILYTLGEHWTQRYVVLKKGKPMVRPDIWSIQSGQWISSGTYSRSWYRFCAGCHTTAFNPFKGTFLETGVGCEACHGPGKVHCETTDQFDIVNPANLTESRRDMICESCHTSGHDRSGQFRFPVGYVPGGDLTQFFKGLVPKPGQDITTYKGDGTYEDRHRQFDYWMSNYNITQGVLCDVCKNFRQSIEGGSGEIYLSSSEFCATCHSDIWNDYLAHSRHTPDEVECIGCHTPSLSKDKKRYSIHDHRFQFGPPMYKENLTMEERCRLCHEDETMLSLEKK